VDFSCESPIHCSVNNKMLGFLSRDGANAQALVNLKRKSDSAAITSKVKKSSASKLLAVPTLSLMKKAPSNASGSLSSAQAQSIVQSFVQEDFFINFPTTVEKGDSHVLPTAVLAVMEQLRCELEVKFGEKKSSTKIKFMGRTKKPLLTWKQRGDLLYFLLHPGFGNGDIQLTAEVFGIPNRTIRTWLNEKKYFPRWLPFVKDLQPYKVQKTIPSTTGQIWKDVPAETLSAFGPLDLSKYESAIPNPQTAIVQFTQASFHNGSHISKQKKVALAQKFKDKFEYVGNSEKWVGKTRDVAYPEQEKFVMQQARENWDKGTPLAREGLYDLLRKQWPEGDPFHEKLLLASKVSPLSQWVSRALSRNGMTIRKSTVSQKVPDNWVQIAQVEAERISQTFRDAEVDILVNADETFIRFYPETNHVIAPIGSKRVGSTNTTQDKKGLTGMLCMEMYTSQILDPFIVLDGTYEGTLSKQWANYAGSASVHFQKNHWMDKIIAKKFLHWLRGLYPGKKIGLIWDRAAAHISDEVVQCAKELGIIVELLHAGMTAIMQPCDIWLNKAIKTIVKKLYYAYKNSLKLETGQKVEVPREQIITWIEQAVREVDVGQRRTRKIASIFEQCGLNPHDLEKVQLGMHLQSLSEDSIYDSLIQNQKETNFAELYA